MSSARQKKKGDNHDQSSERVETSAGESNQLHLLKIPPQKASLSEAADVRQKFAIEKPIKLRATWEFDNRVGVIMHEGKRVVNTGPARPKNPEKGDSSEVVCDFCYDGAMREVKIMGVW